MIKTEGMLGLTSGEGGAPDAKELAAVKEILGLLAQTVSHMKLYPSRHSSVGQFRRQLFDKLTKFFSEADELEVDIQQNSFIWRGEIVFKDLNVLRSLPYLFFKDGMKKLAFLHGLDNDELETFLVTVREISLLPVDVGDIVDALWQQDLSHVRYVAPDDYLESKVTVQQRIPAQFQIRREDLFTGRIDLKPEDVAEMFAKMRASSAAGDGEEAEYAARFAPLDAGEVETLEATMEAQRRSSPDKDFLDLTLELLNIEERPEVFSNILEFLKKFHQVQLHSLDFVHAALLLAQIEQVAETVAGKVPAKEQALAEFKAALDEAFPEKDILRAVCDGAVTDLEPFFLYLSRVGPTALPLGAELAGHGPNEGVRARAVHFLEEMGRRDPSALAKLAQDSRPEFTRFVIAVFAKIRDPRTIPFVADIIGFKLKSSRLKAIQALGVFPEPEAQRILTGLLDDEEEDIRTQAADAVRLSNDPETVTRLIQDAGRKKFHRKSAAEKTAVLKALGRSRTPEAVAFLCSTVLGASLLEGRRGRETRLAAVAALEANGGPAAIDALSSGGARRGSRRVRAACQEALARLKPGRPAAPGSAA